MAPPPWPDGIVRFTLAFAVGPTTPTSSLWLNFIGGAPADVVSVEAVITDFVTWPLPVLLNCVHSACSVRTCRYDTRGSSPFRYESVLAPNAGALTPGQSLSIASGLYVQGTGVTRGGGSRLKIPGVPNEFTTDFAYLSDYGEQQLQFLADALSNWVQIRLPALGYNVELGTLQTRTAAGYLPAALWDPATALRPTLRLENLARRQYMTRGIPST